MTCKTEFRVQFKNNKVKQVQLGEFTSYLVLTNRDKTSASSLAIVNHQAKTAREFELPEGATHHAIQVSRNYFVCLYVNQDGVLESLHVDLEIMDVKRTNYFITDVTLITATPKSSSIGFNVLTERESFFFSLNGRYNASDDKSVILNSNEGTQRFFSELKPKAMCLLKNLESQTRKLFLMEINFTGE